MDTRRDFLKKAALLAGSAGFTDGLPASIQRALAIAPKPGTTYLDAEHVVVLMQENRSFDHCYGMLRGVRGFNDPRAITLPDNKPVWLQTNRAGQTYAPFRLNLRDTKATWMSSLPHSWTNQVDARNGGKYDKWLDAKPSGNPAYAQMPLTMGYYDRNDIPFYYALADAFTICDQNFCSSLTGTTPNRLFFWTGTVRENADALARVRNEDLDYDKPADWKTFPERLEDNGISWRIYQNEISLPSGLNGDEDAWLSNFTDNPLEWFSQYNVRASASYQRYRLHLLDTLPGEISALEKQLAELPTDSSEQGKLTRTLAQKQQWLTTLTNEKPVSVEQLSARERALHEKAFTTNTGDPDYRSLTKHTYQDGDTQREVLIPKGDVLHQFRSDVQSGTLPTVSWVVAPENFSDHPGAPWYGAWYLSEMIDILTKNPEVWQKTIFILAYDENDGYFDHIPPFVAPHPDRPETGKTTDGLDTKAEHVSPAQEHRRTVKNPQHDARDGAIGLGYRVPLVIASPWSRGGYVNSEVFDHTSVLQFLEGFIGKKYGKDVRETNISPWRRTVCGDLTSVFRPYNGEPIALPTFVPKDPFFESVHKAKFKQVPSNFHPLSADEIRTAGQPSESGSVLPRQEPGTRPACPLPYELSANGRLNQQTNTFDISLSAGNERFGKRAAGAPFMLYNMADHSVRDYALTPGTHLFDSLPLAADGTYAFRVYGPNGFFRDFTGNSLALMPTISVALAPKSATPELQIRLTNPNPTQPLLIELSDESYRTEKQQVTLAGGRSALIRWPLSDSRGWYDFSIRPSGPGTNATGHRFAGRVETGAETISDPAMG
ncbi:phosphocholine-specific phospholipase C [Spirosoma rhododendri]|uniref:phospholipase C n=1 Tax=Spirosoma rhododendri TaxID=2728024 RepID=A0A7L5DM35_9BACT|nr:phospholipase C, phosphocholine-specific [Spirosoma rhododendri]QJD79185.1 phospholipase C, phosphocholine-specific [Spirosoma rhododendri]